MSRLINPFIARTVARRFAGDEERAPSYLSARLLDDLTTAVPASERLVAEVSGIPPPSPVEWDIVTRAKWAERNLSTLRTVLAPVVEKADRTLQRVPAPIRVAQSAVVSAEVGALLGYISRRVLGQYDVMVSDDGLLYFVGANMVETERRFGFVPEDFALWVAVHEVTHRFQFAGVPWLKQRFMGLLNEYLSTLDLDARSLGDRLKQAVVQLRDPDVPNEERNPVYLLSTPEQRGVMNQIQALMALVEGHGNFVMDYVGERHIPSFRRMRNTFERKRSQTNLTQKVFNQVIGLELKLRQYEIGRDFCAAVFEQRGLAGVARLWADEETFPTLEELRTPDRWMQRVAA